jgi:hypothetical protein
MLKVADAHPAAQTKEHGYSGLELLEQRVSK